MYFLNSFYGLYSNAYLYPINLRELKKTTNKPIDIVIAWVDGDDPVLKKKRDQFMDKKSGYTNPNAALTRFRSLNEVEFCVLSILRFAPFIRSIFIVTDGQDPKVDNAVKKHFPKRLKDIRVVDHKEIFEGFESFLPTFNSICISNMLWRIRGLSEHFVYFNDDIFITQTVHPQDWFVNDHPVIRGKWVLAPYERLLWDGLKKMFFPKKYGVLNASFQVNQWNAASMLGFYGRYFRSGHTPLALKKSTLANYFSAHQEVLKNNIAHRFRHYSQFNTVALANHLEIKRGNPQIRKSQAIYMQPQKHNVDYVEKKMKQVVSEDDKLFLCVQSLDMASYNVQNKVLNSLQALLKI